jgi:hypothetical protein
VEYVKVVTELMAGLGKIFEVTDFYPTFYYNGVPFGTSDIHFVTGILVNACRLQLKCDGIR